MRLSVGFLLVAVVASAQSGFTLQPPTLPTGLRGSGYAASHPGGCRIVPELVRMTATGGNNAWTYSISSGSLPPGVTLLPSGVFIGEATAEGSYTFEVRADDTSNSFIRSARTITILPQPSCGPLLAVVGQPALFPFSCAFTGHVFEFSSPAGAPPPGISVNPATGHIAGTPTQEGDYSFDWRCFAGSLPATMAFTVRMTVSPPAQAAPVLTSFPAALMLNASSDGPGIVASSIAVESTANVAYEAATVTESGGDWLSVTPASGHLSPSPRTTFAVQADASALGPGTYVGRIEIRPQGGTAFPIPVTLSKARLEKQLRLTQTGVTLRVEEGAPSLTRTFFNVLNGGSGAIQWTATASTLSGGDWLQPTRLAGDTSQAESSFPEGAAVNPAGLAPGAYYGFIEVSAPDAANSPQRATVVLDVQPRGVAVTPLVQPQGAIYVGRAGAPSSMLQFFDVTNTSAATVNFTVSSQTEDGGPWLPSGAGALLPSSGPPVEITPAQAIRVAPGITERFAPLVRTDGLAEGTYRGRVSLAFDNGSTVELRIALVITPAGAALAEENRKQQAGACTPNRTIPALTELGDGGPPSSGWAQAVSVQAVDNCGNPVERGSATTEFTGVASPQTPLTNFSGRFNGVWTPPPTGSETEVEVTVTVTDQDGNTGTTSETVALEPNPLAPPIVVEGGVVHAASFAREPLAPGTIVSIFGSDLSPRTVASGGAQAASLPLATELGETRITLAGEPMPLLFVREDQINAILPFELGDRAADELPLVVERVDKQSLSSAQRIVVSAARPGIFTQTGAGTGPGSILDANFALVNGDNPAAPGQAIVLFATGLGPTSPPVPTGAAAPVSPLAQAAQEIRVTVAGVDADVLFAGLSPGFAGLFQVNIVVPPGTPPGEAEVVVYSGGQPSQIATVAVR